MSEIMESYLAGILHCLPHILPIYAPTTNSYKRYVKGSWAATSVSWGVENRTTAIRIIPHGEQSTRIENRVPGADANPYLTMAASLASGLYGIRNNLKLDTTVTQGNEYENTYSRSLPSDLLKATEAMENSDIPIELFGEGFTDHFIRTRKWEWDQQDAKQANWEIKRYFEVI